MPETKEDNRNHVYFLGMILFGAVAGFLAMLMFGVGAALSVLGMVLAGCAIVLIRLVYFYNCPTCKRRLDTMPSPAEGPDIIRHYCQQCDVIWKSGIEVGGSGDTGD